jgi:hypothetical protein
MKKNILLRIVVLTALVCVTSAQSLQQKKPWTFLVYLAGANDLDSFIQQNMDQMMEVGSNDKINILVYLSTHFAGKNKETKKLYINKGSFTQYGPTMSRDSGNVETFKSALAWACNDFPSDRIAVVLWDHGSGPLNRAPIPSSERGICYDFDTGHYLTDRDLLSAFSWARDTFRRGKKFDIVAFDACLMASLEIGVTLSSSVNYMVASEDSIPGYGFDYNLVLNQFRSRVLDPLSFAKRMVSAYQEEYARYSEYTLSAVDLQVIGSFVNNFNQVSQFLTNLLKLQGSRGAAAKNVIKKSLSQYACPCFAGIYVDILQFYKNILKNIPDLKVSIPDATDLQVLLSNGIAQFPYFVRANTVSNKYKQAGGLTIYFDPARIDASYSQLYWTEINSAWFNLLKAYAAV